MPVVLRHVLPPAATPTYAQPAIHTSEYQRRVAALRAAAPTEWVVVYGDREHAANLAFLCGFDPRFEEALLVLGPQTQAIIVGNEGLGYTPLLGLDLTILLAQSLSLMGQPREQAPRLGQVLGHLGIGSGARVGVVGWKYLEAEEADDPSEPAFVPAMLVNALRRLVGPHGHLIDLTHLLMHPVSGLKSHNRADQIANYAWAAEQASEAVLRIVRGARPGMSELEVAGLMGYRGQPLACHTMIVSGDDQIIGLRSPSARRLAPGDGVTTAIGYWGSLCCRAGLLRETPDPSFQEHYVAPYFQAIAAWWQQLRIGATGGSIHAAVLAAIGDAPFQPALNPGHLIAIDEWTHTPIRPDSHEQISSGMVFQCDIIPTPLPPGHALNCEDSVAVADAALRAEIAAGYPELWARIEQRREVLWRDLGIALPDELLPLSVACASLAPYWLAPDLVCALVP
ncbi:MAG: M24 family metallopeptidase [Roseiflexaceae bacterium]